MLPLAQVTALQHAAKSHASSARAEEHLKNIVFLISDVLPRLEEIVARAIRGPSPLDESARHLIFAGGKRIRPISTLLLERICGSCSARSLPVAAAIELIHSAALLHDDVVDEGEERRGRTASRVVWGNLISVLSGDMLLSAAMELLLSSNIPQVLNDMLETMRAMISGEVLQLQSRGKKNPKVEEYFEIVKGKSASLFAIACRAGARAAAAPVEQIEAASRFGEHFGIAFQIVDDILDIEGVSEEVGKGLGKDLAEGRATLPIILALQDDGEQLESLLAEARTGIGWSHMRVAQNASVRRGCAQARKLAMAETEKGLAALATLPPCKEGDLLSELARSLVDRRA